MAPRILMLGLIAAVGCGASYESEQRALPSEAVLCQVFAGHRSDDRFMLGGYGSLAADVIAAWGEPTTKGEAWVYEWCIGSDCTRTATVTLEFERADVCYGGGKKLGGSFVTSINADGLPAERCWMYSLRQGVPTCEGCLNIGDVGDCQ